MNVPADQSEQYYRLRETHERELAGLAADKHTRDTHLQCADRYRRLAEQAAAGKLGGEPNWRND